MQKMKRQERLITYSIYEVIRSNGEKQTLTNFADLDKFRDDFLDTCAKGPYGEPVELYPEISKQTRQRWVLVYIMNPKPWKIYEAITQPSRN